jgi:hypothetical protein
MPTPWTLPNTIVQTAEAESHIPWDPVSDFVYLRQEDGEFTGTVKPLLHIANPTTGDLRMKTWYLMLSNFSFQELPTEVSGIEVELRIERSGRIADDTIQLQINNEFIGDNKSTYELDYVKTYGSPTDMWGTNLTSSDLLNPLFGIGIRFQSHPFYPHNAAPLLDYVKIRVW